MIFRTIFYIIAVGNQILVYRQIMALHTADIGFIAVCSDHGVLGTV